LHEEGVCSTTADYEGGCKPIVDIGIESDVGGAKRIANARQFRIGIPTQTDWRWDGAVGTFMIFTTDPIAGCTTAAPNQAYAVWSGSTWEVQYAEGGCPKLFPSMQAATPLHLGDARYKLYFGDSSNKSAALPGSKLPFLGPKRLLYADGAKTAPEARVDFEDWEPKSKARELTFLWPDGTPLDERAEGYIDDFVPIAPTGKLSTQVLYIAITDGMITPFAATAVLVNP